MPFRPASGPLGSIDAASYHDRTRHRPERYAASLGYLDWATQPDPFRRFPRATVHPLPREPWTGPAFGELGGAAPEPLDLAFVGRLLFHALALSAWKAIPGATWSLRVNPSSGNLHPTEGYLLCGPVAGLAGEPALYHYAPNAHALEERAQLGDAAWRRATAAVGPCVLVGLASIHWRESWKYGERAYRYCQHDAGHAVAAVAYAAACLGWHAKLCTSPGDEELAALLGIDDQRGPEAEHPDCLLLLTPQPCAAEPRIDDALLRAVATTRKGHPNALSPEHHDWPVIDAVAAACAKPAGDAITSWPDRPALAPRDLPPVPATKVIRERRSAVAMDGRTHIDRDSFYRMLDATLAGRVPATALPWRPRVHLALFVHRVDGLPPGLYALERGGGTELRALLPRKRSWTRPAGCPDHLPLWFLEEGDARPIAKMSSCHQDIAADGCFAVALLAEFASSLREHGEWFYRALHWEAGLVGQVLYLEAGAAGVSATGIGCFFDDLTHAALGCEGWDLQVLYHFTVGGAVEDTRLQTLAAYHHLGAGGQDA